MSTPNAYTDLHTMGPEQLHQARLVVAGYAKNLDDARLLFDILGLYGQGPINNLIPIANPKRAIPQRRR